MKKNKPRKYSKLDTILEIPREVVSTDIKITINGFNEVLIENYKNILEYQDILIKINTFDGAVTIYGFNLKLEQMTDEDIKVNGKIDSIEFETIED
jgi:sporulation protein YqfC